MGISPSEPPQHARVARIVLSEMHKSLIEFKKDCGRLPNENTGLRALIENKESCDKWGGPYLKKLLTDPWGNPYFYQIKDGIVCIGTNGADGKPGGTGNDQDIEMDVQ